MAEKEKKQGGAMVQSKSTPQPNENAPALPLPASAGVETHFSTWKKNKYL